MEREINSRIVVIDSLSDERLRPYQNLKERTLRGESIFISEGSLVVERLLRSSYEVDSVLITRKHGLERCLELVPEKTPIYAIDEREALSRLVGFEFSRGILAIGRRKPLPDMLQGLESFFNGDARRSPDTTRGASVPKRRAWIILPDATKPDNLGLVFRCGSALDAEAVVLGEQCCDPFSRRALRVSMGGVLQTPIYQAKNLAKEIQEARRRWNLPFYSTVLDDSAASSYEFGTDVLAGSQYAAFVFGNEYSGLSSEFVSLCDHCVKIPMRGDVDSLNLGVSVGIFLYEFNRWNVL